MLDEKDGIIKAFHNYIKRRVCGNRSGSLIHQWVFEERFYPDTVLDKKFEDGKVILTQEEVSKLINQVYDETDEETRLNAIYELLQGY